METQALHDPQHEALSIGWFWSQRITDYWEFMWRPEFPTDSMAGTALPHCTCSLGHYTIRFSTGGGPWLKSWQLRLLVLAFFSTPRPQPSHWSCEFQLISCASLETFSVVHVKNPNVCWNSLHLRWLHPLDQPQLFHQFGVLIPEHPV